ncbi:hypothetical protein NDU88_002501 [Pleurodeles waltl]|uniref:Uncharacterized protein n=1 Tax=Pleurodeles waltl TaxID=8319 RepID=A0AAV7NGP2_PLEWA|nr:hypothetical protein NDU88_002501 [Pleurodeles waltl]
MVGMSAVGPLSEDIAGPLAVLAAVSVMAVLAAVSVVAVVAVLAVGSVWRSWRRGLWRRGMCQHLLREKAGCLLQPRTAAHQGRGWGLSQRL